MAKCKFFQDKITYLGHIISPQGLEKNTDKVEAISKTPIPRNLTEVRAFVGMINYYSRLIPNLAWKMKPLYDFLHKDATFKWSEQYYEVFELAKEFWS